MAVKNANRINDAAPFIRLFALDNKNHFRAQFNNCRFCFGRKFENCFRVSSSSFVGFDCVLWRSHNRKLLINSFSQLRVVGGKCNARITKFTWIDLNCIKAIAVNDGDDYIAVVFVLMLNAVTYNELCWRTNNLRAKQMSVSTTAPNSQTTKVSRVCFVPIENQLPLSNREAHTYARVCRHKKVLSWTRQRQIVSIENRLFFVVVAVFFSSLRAHINTRGADRPKKREGENEHVWYRDLCTRLFWNIVNCIQFMVPTFTLSRYSFSLYFVSFHRFFFCISPGGKFFARRRQYFFFASYNFIRSLHSKFLNIE